MNLLAVRSIYRFEMARAGRTLLQSIVSPVLSTSLYFVVFGAAIGSRIAEIEGVSYGAFIVPGLIMLTLHLQARLEAIPEALAAHRLALAADGSELVYTYDTRGERTGITALLADLSLAGIRFRDLETSQSSLEDIFVDLVRKGS